MSLQPIQSVAVLLLLAAGSAGAQTNDMFPSRQGALVRAKQLQCSGAFAMGEQWMPCKDFASYEKAVAKQK